MKKLLITSTLLLISSFSFAQSVNDMLNSAMSGKKPKVQSEYKFTASATYQMVSGKKNDTFNYKYYYSSSDDGLLGIEMTIDSKSKTRSVADFKNKGMIMFMDDQKMVMSMSVDFDKAISEANSSTKYTAPQKTGKTKTILGYNCEEWVSDADDMKMSFWITTNAPFEAKSFYKYLYDSYRKQKIILPTNMSGFPMEMEGVSKDGKKNFKSTCTAVDKNSSTTFSTAGYKIM